MLSLVRLLFVFFIFYYVFNFILFFLLISVGAHGEPMGSPRSYFSLLLDFCDYVWYLIW